jgi:adhesin/invasin
MKRKVWGKVFVTVSLMMVLTACTTGFKPAPGSSAAPLPAVTATSGTPQSHAVNGVFGAALVATVTTNGSPTSGVIVTFTAPSIGPSATFSDTSSITANATSDANGIATSPAVTANGIAGAYNITATITGTSGSASFSLSNTTGSPAAIIPTSGTPQSTPVNSAFPALLAATVVDSGNNPVNGAVVTFTAPATGASGTFAGSSNVMTATTNASGVATSTVFTANGTSGTDVVTATVAGVSTPATFNLSNGSGAAATIVAASGTPQNTGISTPFAAPLVAAVLDSASNPVAGAVVTFQAPTTGATGTFANGTATEIDTTNASGLATSTTFTANSVTGGPYSVIATTPGVQNSAAFSLTNRAAANTYVFYLSGEESSGTFYALAGAVEIDGTGKVLAGEQDYNNGANSVFTSPQPSGDTISGGTLSVSTTGQGTLTLTTNNTNLGVNGVETLGVQFVNSNHALIIQFDGTATSSGSMDLQKLTGSLNGGYAFAFEGVDPSVAPVGFGGVLSITGGTTLSGSVDENDNGTVTMATALSGTLAAANSAGAFDSFGRGIFNTNLAYSGVPVVMNFYVVNPEVIRLIDVDTTDSAVGSAYGQGANGTNASNASLGNSVFAIEGSPYLVNYATAGIIKPTSSAGTFTGIADDNELFIYDVQIAAAPISGTYAIGSNGYGNLTITPGSFGDVSALGIYMTDPNLNLSDPNNATTGLGGALVADMDGALAGGIGVIVPQTDTSTASFTGNYAFGAQDFYNSLEFDFVGQGAVTSGALSGTGMLSDPFSSLGASTTDKNVTFTGTPLADSSNAGRYTMFSTNATPNPLNITIGSTTTPFDVVIYQASGGQLFWLNEDVSGVSLGSLQQQGSLSGIGGQGQGGAVAIAATSGTPQSATINTAFSVPLVATVTTGGLPTSGVVVTFTAPSSGASGTFAGGAITTTATTNASGVATSAAFTANATTGTYTVTATAPGASTPASFSLTNTTPPVEIIMATSGTPQSAVVNTAFAAPMVATVTTGGLPDSGVLVTFTAPSSGASGTFAGGSITSIATTNASGVATSEVFTANATTGTYTVAATVTGVSTPADFTLTNTAAPVEIITATSGTPQRAEINKAFAQPLAATVTTGGSPDSGVVVTFTAPASGASGTFAGGTNTITATTNASGVATSPVFTANGTAGAYTVTATVSGVSTPADFSLTNTTGANTYVFYLSGQEAQGPDFYALAGAVKIDATGKVVAGKQDYNDGGLGFASPEPSGDLITGGSLSVNANGQGTLTLQTNNSSLGANGLETLGVQFVNTSHALIIQFDGIATSSGSMDLQTLPGALSGGYAFTLSGEDSGQGPVEFGGVFSITGGTTLENGLVDTNDYGAVTTGAPLSGTLTAFDSFGRGSLNTNLNYSGTPIVINYYVVGAEAIRIIDVDTGDSAVGSAFGQGVNATAANNASLGNSVFGLNGSPYPANYAALGMFSTSNTSSAVADFSGVADDSELVGYQLPVAPISGTYSIASNGYGSLAIASGDLGDVSALGIYMTDPNLNLNDPNNTTSGLGGALLADMDSVLAGGSGFVVPQTNTATSSFTGKYAFGAQAFDNGLFEFDFVGQGSVTSGVFSGTGLISDPFLDLNANTTNSGVTFSGTPLADTSNSGRYTLFSTNTKPNPLKIIINKVPTLFDVVIYQASGGELFWLNEDPSSVFLGTLQQLGSLTGVPSVRRAPNP